MIQYLEIEENPSDKNYLYKIKKKIYKINIIVKPLDLSLRSESKNKIYKYLFFYIRGPK